MLVDDHHPGVVFGNQIAIVNLEAQMRTARWRKWIDTLRRSGSEPRGLPTGGFGRLMPAIRNGRGRQRTIEPVQLQGRTRRWLKPQLQRSLRIVAIRERSVFCLADGAFCPSDERLPMLRRGGGVGGFRSWLRH